MTDNTVVSFDDPTKISALVEDSLSDFLRVQAQVALQAAVQHEVNEFISYLSENKLADGRQRVVRNGYLPKRALQTGIGGISINVPRVRDRKETDASPSFAQV